jgi:tetratricopeptide (TPR) repeat protein
MNKNMIDIIYRELNQRQTEDLLEIWEANDREEYTDEAFEAIRRILTERIPEGPPQQAERVTVYPPPPGAPQPMVKNDYSAEVRQRREEGARRKRLLVEEIEARLNLADDFLVNGELEKALEEYDTIIAKAPRNAEALLNRATVCEDLGLLERAISDYRKVLEIEPGNTAAALYLQDLLEQDGDIELPSSVELNPPLPSSLGLILYPPSEMRGWPGFRTRPGRFGLDPVDTPMELAHMQGVYAHKLLSGKLFEEPAWIFILGTLFALIGLGDLLSILIVIGFHLTSAEGWILPGIALWFVSIMGMVWLVRRASD